jgi:hypothetical protein
MHHVCLSLYSRSQGHLRLSSVGGGVLEPAKALCIRAHAPQFARRQPARVPVHEPGALTAMVAVDRSHPPARRRPTVDQTDRPDGGGSRLCSVLSHREQDGLEWKRHEARLAGACRRKTTRGHRRDHRWQGDVCSAYRQENALRWAMYQILQPLLLLSTDRLPGFSAPNRRLSREGRVETAAVLISLLLHQRTRLTARFAAPSPLRWLAVVHSLRDKPKGWWPCGPRGEGDGNGSGSHYPGPVHRSIEKNWIPCLLGMLVLGM